MKLKKILYPTDFSDYSHVALGYAKGMVEKFGAELHCLHVIDESHLKWLTVNEIGLRAIIKEHDFNQAAQTQMDKLVQQHFNKGMEKPLTKIITGKPFVEIIRYARDNDIDLIVLATHGHGALTSMLLGSVAEKVIRKSPCAILAVRHPDYRYEAP